VLKRAVTEPRDFLFFFSHRYDAHCDMRDAAHHSAENPHGSLVSTVKRTFAEMVQCDDGLKRVWRVVRAEICPYCFFL
jgi:hypothetical protein